MIVYTLTNKRVLLEEKPISSGGEGAVYKVIDAQKKLVGSCVKLYNTEEIARKQADRIKYMVNNPPKQIEGPGFLVGWPLECIVDSNKRFIGFAMPLAYPGSVQLSYLTSIKLSKKLGDEWTRRYDRSDAEKSLNSRLKLICNISIPVYILHSTGKYILKDFKPENVLITCDGRITLVDMDSIQISDRKRMLYPGTAATPNYMPPEFYNKGIGKSKDAIIEKTWDQFAIGVVFYQILIGLHPFVVTPQKTIDDSSQDIYQNISQNLFPFGEYKNQIKSIPSLHNQFKELPKSLQILFKRALSDDCIDRPGADEWGKCAYAILNGEDGNGDKNNTGRIVAWIFALIAAAILCFIIFQPHESQIEPIPLKTEQNDTILSVQSEGETLFNQAKQENDSIKARDIMLSAASIGFAPAQFEIGKMYYKGIGYERNYKEAAHWYQKAIDQDNADAMAWMSDLYIYGYGVEKDYNKALELIKRSADKGNGYGISNLGYMYFKGYSVNKDCDKALSFFRKSAEMGNEWGMSWLGTMYQEGYGVSQNYSEAMKWYKKCIEAGDESSYISIGLMYEKGLGVERSYIEAEKWYRKALAKGNVSSMPYIGRLYLLGGYGIEQNYGIAHDWFQNAADKGDSRGMFYVGHDYLYGHGVTKDLNKAKEWMNKALEEGIESAKEYLDKITEEEKESEHQTIQNSDNQNDAEHTSAKKTEFTIDDITYSYSTPTISQIINWKSKYKSTCRNKLQSQISSYSISEKMISNDPCLAYLILNSRFLSDIEEKKEWIKRYNVMTNEQIMQLYDILYREFYKLAEIEYKYELKREEIRNKYR